MQSNSSISQHYTTHTHIYMYAQAHTYTRTHTHPHIHVHTHTHTHIHMHTHNTHTCTHAGTHTYTHNTQMHTRTRACTHKRNDITSFPILPTGQRSDTSDTHVHSPLWRKRFAEVCPEKRQGNVTIRTLLTIIAGNNLYRC